MSASKPELSDYEKAIFEQWLEIYKRSATTRLLLKAVADKPRYSKEIHDYIGKEIDGKWSINEKSMHRTLRRLSKLDLIKHTEKKVKGSGLKKKVYSITPHGSAVLEAMIDV